MIITNTESIQVFKAILRTNTTYAPSDLTITLLREGQEDATTYVADSLVYEANNVSVTYTVDDITLLDGQRFLLSLTDSANKLLFRDKMSVEGEEVDSTGQFTFVSDELSEDEYTLIDVNTYGGGDKHYTHNQSSAQSTWNITHNLGKFPSLSVVDSSKNVVIGDVQYIDANSLSVTFTAAFSGKAYMN
jgi:sulfite reductase alpha subunit-like flavoprotein